MQLLSSSALATLTCLVLQGPDVGKGVGPKAPQRSSSCQARGMVCEFGESGGCSVMCLQPMKALCLGAQCDPYGFPIESSCRCVRGP
jgi:hypothetical protein